MEMVVHENYMGQEDTVGKAASATNALTVDTAIELYRRMVLIRRFEEQVSKLFAKNKLPGFVHLYIGQEAVAVGVCSNLRDNDYITSTHRGHGHIIAKGGEVNKMMAELYGKVTGYCKGKGGSMHITDMQIGMLGANGIVAGGIPIAVGAGYGAAKIRKTDQVVVTFFGDGATAEGPFWEGINITQAWNLPVVFVCENNLYGVGTRLGKVMGSEELAPRVQGFDMPVEVVNGNDVVEVRQVAAEAVERARKGQGPTFIECKTWRHRGHFEGENPTYFDQEEYNTWMKRDPIKTMEGYIQEHGLADQERLRDIQKQVEEQIQAAVEFAEKSEFPQAEDALEDIFV
jgi:pyruvate dehydrogenase E1 component alpha subunit